MPIRTTALLLAAAACAAPPPAKPHYEPPRPAPPVSTAPPSAAGAVAASPEPQNGAAQASPEEREAARPGLPADGPSGVIAVVDGRSVPVSELIELWYHADSQEVYAHFQRVVERRIVEAEAKRIGLTVSEEKVQEAVTTARAAMQARVQELAPELTLEQFLRRRWGQDPEHYFAVLAKNQEHGLVFERVVRSWLLTHERAEIRAIFIAKEDSVQEVQAALDEGRTFEEVARAFSRDPSRDRGGRMAPVVRSESFVLSRLAFGTPVGTVTGPVDSENSVLWLKVESIEAPIKGAWSEIAVAVEASLAERPVEDDEVWQWRASVRPFHEVDERPFLELIGEKRRGS